MKKKLILLLYMTSLYSFIGLLSQCILLNVAFATDLNAQQVKSVKEVFISTNYDNEKLNNVFTDIENKTNFKFVYDKNDSFLKNRFTFKDTYSTVEDLLLKISQHSNLIFRQVNTNISVQKTNQRIKVNEVEVIIQTRNITGKVTSYEDGEGLPGVNVVEKGTSNGTVTDVQGNYSLEVSEGATLVFSSVGYTPEEVEVGNRSTIDLAMTPDIQQLQELVVVGYGTQRKGEVTVAVSQVRGEELESIPKTSIMETLGGRAPGVDVISSSGAPGAASKIRIRGANSIRSGAEPLYVIDGFPVAATMNDLFAGSRVGVSGDQTSLLSMINPNDIESIEFLKDAAATSIYGARGANGVVIITTKSGKVGRSDVTLSVNTGLQTVARQWDLMNANQFSRLLYDAYNRGGIDMQNQGFNPGSELAIPTDYNTDWLDQVIRPGLMQDYNLSFSGASDKINYSGSVGYHDNDGVIKNTKYRRYTARLNAESKAWNDRLRMGVNLNASFVDQKAISNSRVYQNAMIVAPNYPVYFPEGTAYEGYLTHSGGAIPIYEALWGDGFGVASSDALNLESPLFQTDVARNPSNQTRIIGNGFLSLELIDGLVAKTSLGADLNYSKLKYLVQSEGPYRPSGGSLEHKQFQNSTWLVENTLTYSKAFGKHSFSALLGQSAQKFQAETMEFAVEEYVAGEIFTGNNPFFVDGWFFDNGVHDRLSTLHKKAEFADWTVASYFVRINYNYNDRYLVTATMRRDGSSKFGKDNKWGTFPGISMAWNLHNEDFFNLSSVNQLKIRSSWGVVGNGNIDSYLSQPLLISSPSTYIGVINAGTATRQAGLFDTGLSWENTSEVDVGFDAFLFNRWSITADAYWKNTYDLLYGFALPESTGFSDISTTNLGSLKQFGLELSVSGDIIKARSKGGLNWNATLNMDHLQGKITELPSGTDWVGSKIRSYVDEPIGEIYGYLVDGVYNTQTELDAEDNPYPAAQLGDYRYRDVGSVDEFGNFIHVLDTNITGADRVSLGNVNPLFGFGFNNTFTFGDFDLNVFFRGSVGNKIYNMAKRDLLMLDGSRNTLQEAVQRWSPDNNSQTIQAANSNRSDPTGEAPISTFVEDGSYIRLANLNFGYTLPENAISSIGIQSLRLYASINNLFVISGYSGLDPEVGGADVLVPRGIDAGSYPKTRIFSLGLNVKF